MDKIVQLTKEVFKNDLLGLSPKISELSEMVWFIFKMGGSVPSNVISSRFPDFKTDLENLSDLEILRIIDNLVIFSEKFENKLIKKSINEITQDDIYNTLVDNYSKGLVSKYKLNEIIDPLATVLSVVINSTTPEQPVFLSTLLRSIKNSLNSPDLNKSKDILEYYLLKHMELVQLVGGYGINLSEKAKKLVEANQDLLAAYKAKPKLVVVTQETKKETEVKRLEETEKASVKAEKIKA